MWYNPKSFSFKTKTKSKIRNPQKNYFEKSCARILYQNSEEETHSKIILKNLMPEFMPKTPKSKFG